MSYEMSILRKEDLSLYLYIKNIVLNKYTETVEYATLEVLEEFCGSGTYVYNIVMDVDNPPIAKERGRGIVYFDNNIAAGNCLVFPTVSGTNGDGIQAYGVPEQISKLALYETTVSGITEVPWTEYMIDYLDCRVITKRPLYSPYVTYTWNYVSVVDEWPVITSANPPVVVVDINKTKKSGYQLGGGKLANRKANIYIFASNQAERNDLIETIYDGLYNKSCTIYDFKAGTVLDYDGTFYGRKYLEDRIIGNPVKEDYLFDTTKVDGVSSMNFENVDAKHAYLNLIMSTTDDNLMFSNLNAYRATISFDISIYDDRIT